MIYNKNCLDALKDLRDQSFDLCITSPPYNMRLRIQHGKYTTREKTNHFSKKYKTFGDDMPIDDFYKFHSDVLSQLIRVSNLTFYNISIVTGSKRAFFRLIGDFSEHLKEIIVWDKKHPAPSIKNGVLNRRSELILVFGDNPISRVFENANWDRGFLDDLWELGRGRSEINTNSATFPLSLPTKILSMFGFDNCRVIDPFLGSGTTAIAAHDFGYDFLGFELDLETFILAKQRIENHKKQLKLW